MHENYQRRDSFKKLSIESDAMYSMTCSSMRHFTLITFDVLELLYFVKVAIDEHMTLYKDYQEKICDFLIFFLIIY